MYSWWDVLIKLKWSPRTDWLPIRSWRTGPFYPAPRAVLTYSSVGFCGAVTRKMSLYSAFVVLEMDWSIQTYRLLRPDYNSSPIQMRQQRRRYAVMVQVLIGTKSRQMPEEYGTVSFLAYSIPCCRNNARRSDGEEKVASSKIIMEKKDQGKRETRAPSRQASLTVARTPQQRKNNHRPGASRGARVFMCHGKEKPITRHCS